MKEEKVFVTSGKKKASVRKETDAVSVTSPKMVRGRGREVSEPKVTMDPFFYNSADII